MPPLRRMFVVMLTTALLGGSACRADASEPVLPTAEAWTALFADKNDGEWSGADQAASYKAANGATYWLFGDTVLGPEDDGGAYAAGQASMVGNTILVQRGTTLTRATAPLDKPAIPDAANGDRYWANDAFEQGGYLYVTAQRVRRTTDGLGFANVGAELARFRFVGDQLVFCRMVPTPTDGAQDASIQWVGPVVTSGGYVYVYGYRWVNDPYAPHRTYVARVPTYSVTTPSAWRYRSASAGWSGSKAAAAPVLSSQLSSVAIIGGRWVLVHKPWNGWGSEVRAEVGAKPYGPFTSSLLFTSPAFTDDAGRQVQTYSPQLHEAQPLASGKVLLSISWATTWDRFWEDADLYKPRFYEVTLPSTAG